jgi:2-polyprenyl-6-methoxyphenol hydroxylase-like FAD-dependent oxidoreductase
MSNSVCIVGGGPAGMILALILARNGVCVTLLEAAQDFKREFRGDTVHPVILDLFDQLGLTEAVMKLEHVKASSFSYRTPNEDFKTYDMSTLRYRHPYIALIRQSEMLEVLREHAAGFPNFELVMGARVEGLLEENDAVTGVRYRHESGLVDLRSSVVIGADGRFSKVRQLAKTEMIQLSPATDVLWFKLPKYQTDPPDSETDLYLTNKHYIAMLDRADHWQVGYSIPRGSFQDAKREGVQPIVNDIHSRIPWLADRASQLTDFSQLTLLSVQISRAKRWYKPGLLLIGDAAHVISPVGGIGINIAVQDAIATANSITKPLLENRLETRHLAAVQKRRNWQVAILQAQQVAIEKASTDAFERNQGAKVPTVLRFLRSMPFLRDLPARLTAYGIIPEKLQPALTSRPAQ